MRFRQILFAAASSLLLYSCDAITAEEVARVSIDKTSNKELFVKEMSLDLKEGESVSFWTEMDLEYQDNLSLIYTIEVWRDSVKQGGFQLDAMDTNPTMNEVKTSFNNNTSWSYTGKMDKLKIEKDGNYTFKAVINSSENPSLVIRKADLILKK